MQQQPKLWKYIVIPLGIGILLLGIFGGVSYYLLNGSKTSKYNQAVNAYTAGNYAEAAKQFDKLGDYRDSKQRSAESVTRMHYENGKLAFASGEYEKAKDEYLAAGDYENSKLLAEECDRAAHYTKGGSLSSSGDIDKAIEEYQKSGYKDFKDKIAELYIKKSDKAISDGQNDQALEFAKKAAESKGSNEPVLSCYYKMGEEAVAKNDLKNAALYYVNAEEFKDAPDKAKSVYYTLGTDALGQKDYENAASFLKLAGDFKDASSIAKEAFYITGSNRYKEKNYAAAGEFFKLAGDYKDANALYLTSCYTNGLLNLKARNYADAAESFEACGNYKFAKDLVNVCIGEAAVANNKLSDAIAAYNKVSSKAKISGFDIQGRKSFISRWRTIDNISGSHGVISNYIVSWRIKRSGYLKLKKGWKTKLLLTNQAVSIKYSANTDGTFNITGNVVWCRLLNCPAAEADLRVDAHSSDFEFAHVKSFPKTIKLSGGAKLTYKNGKFTVSYKKKSKGVTYQSSIVYR